MDIEILPYKFTLNIKQDDLVAAVGNQGVLKVPVCTLIFPNQSLTQPLESGIESGVMGTLNLSVDEFNIASFPNLESSAGNPADIKHNLNIEEVQGPDIHTDFVPCNLDVLGDGVVGQDDIERIYRSNFVPGLAFDINGDGFVDDQDYLLAQEYIGTLCIDLPPPPEEDNSPVIDLDASNPDSYPGEGDVWYNLANENNNFTLINDPNFIASAFAVGRPCFFFSNFSYAELIYSGDFRAKTYTYMVVCKQGVAPGNQRRRSIVGFSDSEASAGTHAYFCHNLQHWEIGLSNQTFRNFYSNGAGYSVADNTPASGENFDMYDWHFVCVTVRPDTARVVINDEVFEHTGPATTINRKNDFDKIWLATRNPPSDQNLLGYISNFRMYERDLSLEEINEIKNALLPNTTQ